MPVSSCRCVLLAVMSGTVLLCTLYLIFLHGIKMKRKKHDSYLQLFLIRIDCLLTSSRVRFS